MAKQIDEKIRMREAQKRAAIERMWLSYYNTTLLEKGLITRDQHRKMKVCINTRNSSPEY